MDEVVSIGDLPLAKNLAADDEVPINQDQETKRANLGDIEKYIKSRLPEKITVNDIISNGEVIATSIPGPGMNVLSVSNATGVTAIAYPIEKFAEWLVTVWNNDLGATPVSNVINNAIMRGQISGLENIYGYLPEERLGSGTYPASRITMGSNGIILSSGSKIKAELWK